jgi:hypothetical protein
MPGLHVSPELREAFLQQEFKIHEKLEAEYQSRKEAIESEEKMLRGALKVNKDLAQRVSQLRCVAAIQQHQLDELFNGISTVTGDPRPDSIPGLEDGNQGRLEEEDLQDVLGFKIEKPRDIHPARMRFNLHRLDLTGLKKLAMHDLGAEYADIKYCSPEDLRYMLEESYKEKSKPGRFKRLFLIPETRGWLRRQVVSPGFDLFSCIVILINSIFIGFSAEYARRHYAAKSQTYFMETVEWLFYFWYTLELLMKLKVWRGYFFVDPDDHNWAWNTFDFILVLFATWDVFCEEVIQSNSNSNMTWLRVLRLLKMLKMLRMVRVMRFFQELRLMLSSIATSLRVLMWGVPLIVIILYVFSLAFLQGATAYLEDHILHDWDLKDQSLYSFKTRIMQHDAVVDPNRQFDPAVFEYWGSLDRAFLSLYKVITRGEHWVSVAKPLQEAGSIYYGLFMFYILFMVFALINVLKGIYVDAGAVTAQIDRDNVVQEELRAARSTFQEMREVFAEIDKQKKGSASWEDFESVFDDSRVREYFNTFGINDPQAIFEMCENGEKRVDPEEFIKTCTKVRGAAKSLDAESLIKDYNVYMTELSIFMGYVDEKFTEMKDLAADCSIQKDPAALASLLDVKPLKQRLQDDQVLPPDYGGDPYRYIVADSEDSAMGPTIRCAAREVEAEAGDTFPTDGGMQPKVLSRGMADNSMAAVSPGAVTPVTITPAATPAASPAWSSPPAQRARTPPKPWTPVAPGTPVQPGTPAQPRSPEVTD